MTEKALPLAQFGISGSPEEQALSYPGPHPEGNFLTDGTEVVLLDGTFKEFYVRTNEYLLANELPGMEDRVPVLAYGANANPVRIEEKLAKGHLTNGKREELLTIPFSTVEVPNVAAVWHGRPGQKGSVFAELYTGSEVEGETLTTHVAFLTLEQLALIHNTEGVTYSVAEFSAAVGSDKQPLRVFAYTAGEASILLQDRKPVLVQGLQSTATLPKMTAEEAVRYMLDTPEVQEAIGEKDPLSYVQEGLALTLADRKRRQQVVGNALEKAGKSARYEFVGEHATVTGRLALAAFMGIESHGSGPATIILAEEALQRLRPTDEALQTEVSIQLENKKLKIKDGETREQAALRAARRKLDPMIILRERTTGELERRLNTSETK